MSTSSGSVSVLESSALLVISAAPTEVGTRGDVDGAMTAVGKVRDGKVESAMRYG